MPGRGSYGPGGKWIHDRAHHIMEKNPSMAKGVAYALATQQAHKVGRSPKKFRTSEGVRTALTKYPLPKKLYKKTASADMKKIAMQRLRALIKEARAKELGKRVIKYRSGGKNVRRAAKVVGEVKSYKRTSPKYELRVPPGMKAKERGRIERAIRGGPPMKAVPTARTKAKNIGKAVALRAGGELASRLRNIADTRGAARAVPGIISDVPANIAPQVAPKAMSSKKKKILKALGTAGTVAGGGAVGHQIAYSSGMSSTGPADVLANIMVPTEE